MPAFILHVGISKALFALGWPFLQGIFLIMHIPSAADTDVRGQTNPSQCIFEACRYCEGLSIANDIHLLIGVTPAIRDSLIRDGRLNGTEVLQLED
jgi:hypothetical protein